jgi:hypothetical protein
MLSRLISKAVIVFDRDALPNAPTPRPPQSIHRPRDAAGSQSQIRRGRDLRIIPESRQSTSSHSSADVDVVIVGSGPAGSTYARMISDKAPNATVLLVEAGPAITTPPAQHSSTIPDCAALDHAIAMSQGPFCGNDGSTQTSAPEQELSADRGADRGNHRWSSKVLRIGPTACNCLKLKFDDDPKPPNRHVCSAPLSARCSDRFSESRRTQETIVKAWTKSEIVPQRADFLMERRGFKLIVIVA